MTSEIVCENLTKDFGERRAVDALSFRVPERCLTGFVGANGAGKTTTIRMLLGLIEPSTGQPLVAGRRCRDLAAPRHTIGAVLDVPGAHPGHTGRAHLEILAAAAGLPTLRAKQVLDLVELNEHANRRVGTYSLGMRQRLSLAAALLGDPPVLILDEPTKGLDPPGIRWLRSLVRSMVDEGRCVLMSSHHLGELETIADRVVVIDRGKLIVDSTTEDLLQRRGEHVIVQTPQRDILATALRRAGGTATPHPPEDLLVTGLTAAQVGEIAAASSVPLHGLTEEKVELEDVFFGLTAKNEGRDHAAHDR
jgi:ABC-2 type transport system ATP-binding protein